MNPQYNQPPHPVHNSMPPPPMSGINGNPANNLAHQMAGVSLNANTPHQPPAGMQYQQQPPQQQQQHQQMQQQHQQMPPHQQLPPQLPPQPHQPLQQPTTQQQQQQPPFGGNLPPAPYANKQMPPNAQPPQAQQPPPMNNRPQPPAAGAVPSAMPPQSAHTNGANPNAPPPQFNGSAQPAAAHPHGPPQLPTPTQERPASNNPNFPPMPAQQKAPGGLPPMNGDNYGRPPSLPQQMPAAPQAPQGPAGQPPMPGYNARPTHQYPPQPNVGQAPGPNANLQQPPMGMPPHPGQQQQQQQFQSRPPVQQGPYPGQNMPPMPQYQQSMQQPMQPPMQQPQQPPMQPHMPPMQQPSMQPNYPQPGYPGQPNMQPQYNQQPQPQYPPGMAAPQPQRRLDPDQMPNPIQVMKENQAAITGPFVTNEIGAAPPAVTSKFVTHDQGQSGPRYIRSSMYNVPATPDMMKQVSVPFSLILSPFAQPADGEMAPPIVDFGELGPIRCIRCKAYMSPNMQFVDAGRRFRCALCKATTDVPTEYFQHLDHAGQRVDKYERPELVLGTYEFVATKEYCRDNRPSKPPAFVFVIDVSYNNIKSGLVHLLCREMKNILQNLPVDHGLDRSKMKVGFITYNNTVHFYNVKENLAQPQMMVVGDINEMFMPLLDGFFCDADESGAVIDALMEQIPIMFGDTRETETILMPAIQAGLEAIKASECSGKLLVFHSSLPTSNAPGRLQNREDRKLLGGEKEKVILSPQSNVYNNLGQDCVLAGCSVDLFIFNNSYIDLATIGQVARLTGGSIYKYTYFQADIDGARVIADVIKNVSRPIAFEAVMRVRTSAGIRPTDFYGHFFMSNTTDMDLASMASDQAIGVELKHDDKLSPEENVYLQVALLYTSCSGQRRIRILNLALKTCTQMGDLFRCCDLDAMILYFSKQIVFKSLDSTPRAVRDALEAKCAQILACYRKNCASPTSSGQLILPECMKLLPLYVSCLMKNDALFGGSDMSCDDRTYAMHFVAVMDLPMSVGYFYPRLIPIHDVDPDDTHIPAPIRCTAEKLVDNGAYILENGVHLFVWLGVGLAPEFTQAVFNAQCTQQVDTDRPGVPALDNPLSARVRGIIDAIQAERPRCMRVTVVRARDKLEGVLRHYLIEDRSGNGASSYVEFLIYLHKEIRALLS